MITIGGGGINMGGAFNIGETPVTAIPTPIDAQFNYVTALFYGNGANTAQNNTFLDSSTNNFTMTRTGSTTQGSFSPYGNNWSNYFNAGDKLTTPSSSAFDLSGSTWTIEFWMYSLATPTSGNQCRLLMAGANGDAAGWDISYDNTGYLGFFRPYGGSPVGIQTPASTISLNTWYHVAFVCNAGSARIYINGTQVAGPVTITLPTSASQTLRIGYDDVGTVNFQYNGYLSNIRLVKGVAVYTGTFTPPTSSLAATQSAGANISAITGAATVFLTCQSNRFIDNSSNAFALTITGAPSVQRFNPFGNSQTAYTTSVIGSSAYFTGGGDYLQTPSSAIFNLNTGDWTMEGWFYLTAAPAANQRLFVIDGGSVYGMYTKVDGGIYYGLFGTSEVTIAPAGTLSGYNQWKHIAFVKSGASTTTCYVNGVSVGSTTSYSLPNSNSTFYIAGSTPYAANVYAGYISDVRVIKGTALYTATFTPPTAPLTTVTNTQLLLNFANAGIYDSAAMNDVITAGSAQASTTQFKYGTASLKFNGTTDYLTAPNGTSFQFPGDFTIEAWVYSLSATGQANYSGIFDTRATNVSSTTGIVVNLTPSGYLNFYINGNNYTSTTLLGANNWTHIALVRSGSTISMYQNGVSVASVSYATSLTSGYFWVGSLAAAGASGFWQGYIDELRVTKGYARYTATFTPPTAQLPGG
jgi:hypothetical protein